jgi:hypothetical protein
MGTRFDLVVFGIVAVAWMWMQAASSDWAAGLFGAALIAIFVGYRFWMRKIREKAWRDRHTVFLEDGRRRR